MRAQGRSLWQKAGEARGAGSGPMLPVRGLHWSERETYKRVLVPRTVLERNTSPSVQRETEAR